MSGSATEQDRFLTRLFIEHYRHHSGRVVGSSDCCDIPDLLPDFESVPASYFWQVSLTHLQSRQRHVAVLFGVFVHPCSSIVSSSFIACALCARLPGHCNGMPEVVVEFDASLLISPGGTTLGGQMYSNWRRHLFADTP